jgi:hypothetical protein
MTTRITTDGYVDGAGGLVTVTGSAILATGTPSLPLQAGRSGFPTWCPTCTTGGDAAASTLQWSADGTVGAATTFTGRSSSLDQLHAGGLVYCDFTALNTAPVITQTAGVALAGPDDIDRRRHLRSRRHHHDDDRRRGPTTTGRGSTTCAGFPLRRA